MEHYCTLFDKNYLARGLALHGSLAATHASFSLTILCLDRVVFEVLSALKPANVELVPLDLLERRDSQLAAVRPTRTAAEYCFTCKSVLMQHVLETHAGATRVTYLDSDLYFFNGSASLSAEIEGSSVALTPHRFPPHLQDRYQYGRFNAGWVSASSGREGRDFLGWWRERCIDWCYATVEKDRFGDQKYLDQAPGLFPKCHVIESPGSNVAPWNVSDRGFSVSEGKLLIDGSPLVFYHFHGVKRVWWRYYDSGLAAYGAPLTPALRDRLYLPYLRALVRRHQSALRACAAASYSREGAFRPPRPRDVVKDTWSLLCSGTGVFVR